MRILWVKAGKLLPVDTGGKIRSYNIFRHLAKRHDAVLLSYYVGPRDAAYEAALVREFPGSVCVPIREGSGRIGELLHFASWLPRSAPYAVAKHEAPVVRETLDRMVAERKPDVIVCDFLAASLNFRGGPDVPTVLFQHNVESALWKRQAHHEKNAAKRAVFALEASKMARYEAEQMARFEHVVAVSEHDMNQMDAMRPGTAITVVPTGVDVEHFRRPAGMPTTAPIAMFLGSMDWPANIDGVEYFCAEVWPRVLPAVPDARFRVVGRNPPPRIRALASSSVEIVGGVKSVLPDLHSASVFVVPLRIGGGTRLKIYEAMAAGLPIVSTTIGAEGLDVTHGTDILLEDDAASFADAMIDLFTNAPRRAAISAAATATAALFDWSEVSREFEDVLQRTAERGLAASMRA